MDEESRRYLESILERDIHSLSSEQIAILKARRSYLTPEQLAKFSSVLGITVEEASVKDPQETLQGQVEEIKSEPQEVTPEPQPEEPEVVIPEVPVIPEMPKEEVAIPESPKEPEEPMIVAPTSEEITEVEAPQQEAEKKETEETESAPANDSGVDQVVVPQFTVEEIEDHSLDPDWKP